MGPFAPRSSSASGIYRLHSQFVSQLSLNILNAFLSNFSSMLPGAEPGWKLTLLKKVTFSDLM